MINILRNLQSVHLQKVLKAKHVALPSEHGAWIFLFSPLLIGLTLGGFSKGTLPLILALLAAFLIRQPVTIFVKILSGRRSKNELSLAVFWLTLYAFILLVSLLILIQQNYLYILLLAIPALPVFLWHLWLVSKRAERRQKIIEIAASGVLALAAPATFWVGQQHYSIIGWVLWGLSWLQVSGTILYAYLRLEQRSLRSKPSQQELWKMSGEALVFNGVLMIGVLIFSLGGWLPTFIPIAFLIQPIEVLWGTYHPAISTSPKKIGIRQLIISSLFTVIFIIPWLLG